MGEDLSVNNMAEDIDFESIFSDTDDTDVKPKAEEVIDNNNSEVNKEIQTEKNEYFKNSDDIDFESIFADTDSKDTSNEENQQQENTPPQEQDTPPQASVYSTLATAFKEKGIFSAIDDSSIKNINKEEDFMQAMQDQLQASLDAKQQQIDAALKSGVQPDVIATYNNNIDYLESITEDTIASEEASGEKLRKDIIYQDYINKGFSQERALREVDKSFKAGTDIEDAKESLKDATKFYKDSYSKIVQQAKEKEISESKQRESYSETIKKSILNDSALYKDFNVNKADREKIYDNISKPVYTDKESGRVLTALQKYEKENKVDFIKNLGLVFTLTDGFKNMNGLVKNKIKKEVNKGISNLENTLNSTMRNSRGNLEMVSGESRDPESVINSGWTLDV